MLILKNGDQGNRLWSQKQIRYILKYAIIAVMINFIIDIQIGFNVLSVHKSKF